ncbi:MAG: glycosyltransferase [Kamptonema sp. SIO4C4]|nr:glycosyltransferase [Kamptonema sp. SIO4C4]
MSTSKYTKTVLLDVIIPVKNRDEVLQSVDSILAAQSLIQSILLCTPAECMAEPHHKQQSTFPAVLAQLAQWEKIQIVTVPMQQFNKSILLNCGLVAAEAELILIADADILWTPETLKRLVQTVEKHDRTIATVAQVRESQPQSTAVQRDRYTYRIHPHARTPTVEILPVTDDTPHRPGCGLICAKQQTFLALGGYKEIFRGWGWEDQDLLIRAALLGYTVQPLGEVTHLSHSDRSRNPDYQHLDPKISRDRNILAALQSLSQGNLQGDLPNKLPLRQTFRSIRINLPDGLK